MTGQSFVGFDCSLRARGYPLEAKIRHHGYKLRNYSQWWKYGLSSMEKISLRGNRGRIVYLDTYRRPEYGAEFQYVIENSDIVVFDHGLHWMMANREEFRVEMLDYLRQFKNLSTPTKLLIWRGTTSQHFDQPGGYYDASRGSPKDASKCVPMRGDFQTYEAPVSSIDYREALMQNASIEAGVEFVDAFSPDFMKRPIHQKKREVIHVNYREYGIPFHDLHVHGKDCTHYCNNRLVWPTVWRGIRLAMDRAFGTDDWNGAPRGIGFEDGAFQRTSQID